MDIKEIRVSVDLSHSEIWEIVFPMIESLKRSADHYIDHFTGDSESGFIEYVKSNNKGKMELLTSFSNIINRTDLVNELNYHCKTVLIAREKKKQ